MIITKQFQIHAYDPDTIKVVALNARLANKLNKTFPTYLEYKIKEGEEAVFSISRHKIGILAAILPGRASQATLKELINGELVRYNTEELT